MRLALAGPAPFEATAWRQPLLWIPLPAEWPIEVAARAGTVLALVE